MAAMWRISERMEVASYKNVCCITSFIWTFCIGRNHANFKAVVVSNNEALTGKEHKGSLRDVHIVLYFDGSLT